MTACLASSNGARVPSQNDSTHASGPTGLGHQGVWRSVQGSRHLLFRQHPMTGRASAGDVGRAHRLIWPHWCGEAATPGTFDRYSSRIDP